MSDESDSIIVRIAANVAELVAGMQEGATAVQEGMEKMKAAIEALSLAVVGGEVFEKLIEGTAETGVQLEILASKTGATVEELSQLSYAANLSHASTEELSVGIQRLARNMEDANKSATTPAAEAFRALGISATDAHGNLRPVVDVLMDVSQRFSEMRDGTSKTAMAMDLFGRSGANLIPLLDEGRAGIQKLREESDRLGNTWSQEDVEAAVQYEDVIKRLRSEFSGVARELAVALFPALEILANWLHKLTQLLVAAADGWRALFAGMKGDWNAMFTFADQAAAALKKAQDDLRPGQAAPTTGGTGEPPTATRDTVTTMDKFELELDRLKNAQADQFGSMTQLELDFWTKKLDAVTKGSKDYIAIYSKVTDLTSRSLHEQYDAGLASFSAQEAADKDHLDRVVADRQAELQYIRAHYQEMSKEVQQGIARVHEAEQALQRQHTQDWARAFAAFSSAWTDAVKNWKQGGESMRDFWRNLMHDLVREAEAASIRMIVVHNAEWLERKKQIIEGHALEVAQSAWSMIKVVADYAAKAAAAAWSAIAGIPFVGPALAPIAAAATLAGVLALAGVGGGGGGGGGGNSAAAASASRSASSGAGGSASTVIHIHAVDAQSMHNYLMKNAASVAKAAAAGANGGVRAPGSAGRGST